MVVSFLQWQYFNSLSLCVLSRWLVIAVGLVRAYLARGSYHGLYYSIEKPLKFFQTGAILEVREAQRAGQYCQNKKDGTWGTHEQNIETLSLFIYFVFIKWYAHFQINWTVLTKNILVERLTENEINWHIRQRAPACYLNRFWYVLYISIVYVTCLRWLHCVQSHRANALISSTFCKNPN